MCSESGELRKSDQCLFQIWCLLSDGPFFVANGDESNVLSLFHHFDRFQTASWDTCTDVNHETTARGDGGCVRWLLVTVVVGCPMAARDCEGGESAG